MAQSPADHRSSADEFDEGLDGSSTTKMRPKRMPPHLRRTLRQPQPTLTQAEPDPLQQIHRHQ